MMFAGKISAALRFELEVNGSQFLPDPFKGCTDDANVPAFLFQIPHCSDRVDLLTAFNGDVCCVQHHRNYSVEQRGSRQPH